MDAAETTRRLCAWALEEGFDRAGVARLEPATGGGALLRWLSRGEHAGMGYLARRVEARLDPRRILATGARSVLCVALDYHPLGGEPEMEGDLWPRVARYARGEDYHDVMGRRLDRLETRVAAAFPGIGTRRYVDTGPVLERELAAKAGLGAVGKNTNLLDPEHGSWFLLGELFLTLDAAPAAPVTDLCGTCTRCLEACPTEALVEPYRLDARRCISYWTIEHRGPIPTAIRPQLEDWVFGCDVCQEVCPVNESAPPVRHPELELPSERAALDLGGLLSLGRDDYVRIFRGSPMKRAKLEGLRRNAAVAMGNRKDERYLEPLRRGLEDSDGVVRSHSAWALGRLGGPVARRALESALATEEDPEVSTELRRALAARADREGDKTRSSGPSA